MTHPSHTKKAGFVFLTRLNCHGPHSAQRQNRVRVVGILDHSQNPVRAGDRGITPPELPRPMWSGAFSAGAS